MKKLLAIILALATIFCMSAIAFADDETFTLTITGAAGHSYNVYQIYTGTVSVEEDGKTVLSNVKYGENYGTKGEAVTQDALNNVVNAADPIALLKNAVVGHTTPINGDKPLTPAANETSIVIENLAAGYYMIVDVTEATAIPTGETKSPTMLQVVENVTINSKHATIYSEKKVYDLNDSNHTAADTGWADSADHDIGDDVAFKLSVTLPSNFNSYAASADGYTITFHDKQSDAFSPPNITSVYIEYASGLEKKPIFAISDNNENGYEITTTCPKPNTCEFGGCTFGIKIGDITKIYGETNFENGDKIVVKYTSKLNGNPTDRQGQVNIDNINVGKAGNENAMYVCHPDGHTVKDYVTVLTYGLTINKVDGSNIIDGKAQPLKGAGFTLYKGSPTNTAGVFNWQPVGTEIKGENLTTFEWKGLDGGQYKLVETTTPIGYNTIADIEFTIDADHVAEWTPEANFAFEDLISYYANPKDIVFRDLDDNLIEDGILQGDVENHKGVVLPETGAEGTMMLIACGTVLVILASVFMVVRKKMSIFED